MRRRSFALGFGGLLLPGAALAQAQLGREGLISPRAQPLVADDVDVVTWAAQVVTNGGTVSATQKSRTSALVAALKAAGAWALTDDYWMLVAENATCALTSLKQRRLATAIAGPAFAANQGYSFNGTTQYIDTGFIPGTHAVVMTASNVRIAMYMRSDITAGAGNAAGATTVVASRSIMMRPRSGVSLTGGLNTNAPGVGFALPQSGGVSDARGYSSMARNGVTAADCVGYRNGVALTRSTDPTAFGTPLPTHSLYIGADNRIGTAANFNPNTVGLVELGATLSAAQELAAYTNAVQPYMVACGAAV